MATNLSIEDLIKRMQEFDPSDRYHTADSHYDDYAEPGYYAAIDRCIRLLKGEINDWRDK